MTRILLADDHRMLRDSLRRALEDHGFDVVGEAPDGAEAVRLVQALRPDVVLMDVSMPVLDGVEATRQISRIAPESQVVMLTMHADGDVMARAIQAGAVGYLVKDCSIEDVVSTIRLAASGEAVLSPGLASSMLADVKKGARSSEGDAPTISAREEEVLQLVADGLTLPEVAAALYISVKTVKNHLASIYAKLDARDRTQAVLRAVRMGIIRLG
ncbi:MAG: response regulator transcription factor [Actinomycetota bacterium]|jgi:DNA-binding NarL/FixJ family response regulator|nr:response regulator transcription factor [Actinomycetota bacterium]